MDVNSLGSEDPKQRHGGPFDRGSADAYYWRRCNPHYYKGATYSSEKVSQSEMTEEEIAQYCEGYNETHNRKDWGVDEGHDD